jgi:hypothetical protein
MTELHTSRLEDAIVGGAVAFAVAQVLIGLLASRAWPMSLTLGLLLGAAISQLSRGSFVITADAVEYHDAFFEYKIPLKQIIRVGVGTQSPLLPSQRIVFVLDRRSGAEQDGLLIAIGFFDRARAREWAEGLNARLASERPPDPATPG